LTPVAAEQHLSSAGRWCYSCEMSDFIAAKLIWGILLVIGAFIAGLFGLFDGKSKRRDKD
jgi:hypothetical protein